MTWNGRNLALFSISESKVLRWQQDYIHNFIISTKYLIRVSFSQTIRKWDYENLGNLLPPVPSNPPTLPQLSSRGFRSIKKNFHLYLLIDSRSFYFLLELRIVCQLIIYVLGSLAFPIVLATKKTLIVIKTILKTRDSGDEVENEVANSETLNSKTYFAPVSCKVASFPLVLDLMQNAV